MSVFEAIVLAITEGLTEFLPVSSTGHMIIVSSWLGIAADPFVKTYTVAIQLGAIASVVILYWKRFFQTLDFYIKLLIAFLPAAIIGFLFNDYIDQLLERVEVVAVMLILGGILFLFLERLFSDKEETRQEPSNLSALKIGFFQCVAMIPGVSRSAATIIGGLTQKLSRTAAAEFSFFLAVPTMFAATAYKLLKYYKAGNAFGQHEISLLVIGNIVAFAVALAAIKSFIYLVSRRGFKEFGYYRIALGIIILTLLYTGKKSFGFLIMNTGIDQVLLINKPLRWTSFDVVNKLRYRLKIKKVGHAGTLDPLATGLLIICTGKMTKRIDEFQAQEKEYTGKFILGQSTPSYDLETEVSAPTDISFITNDEINAATEKFIGAIQQVPPAHSAIRINGKRAYALARKGKDPDLKAREVFIKEFEITAIEKPEVAFRVVCSKGTYIRSLARDFGMALGTVAYLSELCRTRIGNFMLKDAVSLDQVPE